MIESIHDRAWRLFQEHLKREEMELTLLYMESEKFNSELVNDVMEHFRGR